MTVDSELDLHRCTVDEALLKLDQYLYSAFVAGLTNVCVNHGRGTGVLRLEIQRELKKHTLVKSFRAGDNWEGGIGVTMVELMEH
jgi:DNA mismatch repair protein MutS2